jgi:hypothetical protein
MKPGWVEFCHGTKASGNLLLAVDGLHQGKKAS